jgi:hypothetical protein
MSACRQLKHSAGPPSTLHIYQVKLTAEQLTRMELSRVVISGLCVFAVDASKSLYRSAILDSSSRNLSNSSRFPVHTASSWFSSGTTRKVRQPRVFCWGTKKCTGIMKMNMENAPKVLFSHLAAENVAEYVVWNGKMFNCSVRCKKVKKLFTSNVEHILAPGLH